MSLLDKDQINSMSGGEPAILLPILEDFISSAETLISEAIELANSRELAGIANRLHQLKGSSGTLGLSAFYEACKAAEAVARSGVAPDLDHVKSLLTASTQEATAFMSME